MTEATPATPATPKVLSRVEQLVNDLWDDAELGPKVRAKAKEKWPETRIPEDQITPLMKPLQERLDASEKELKEMREARAKEIKDREERDGQVAMEARLEAARKKYALTDEGFDKMVSRMKETHNYEDAEAAAAWVTDNNPPPKPTSGPSWAAQRMDLFGTQSKSKDENMKFLHNDPDAWFDKAVEQVLSEGKAAA